jgi:hypothetical protein
LQIWLRESLLVIRQLNGHLILAVAALVGPPMKNDKSEMINDQ